MGRVLGGETPAPLEHRIIHKNGEVRWVRHTIVPCRDRAGRLESYDGLIADISQRKGAEEALITSEAFYHSLVENLPQNGFAAIRGGVEERHRADQFVIDDVAQGPVAAQPGTWVFGPRRRVGRR